MSGVRHYHRCLQCEWPHLTPIHRRDWSRDVALTPTSSSSLSHSTRRLDFLRLLLLLRFASSRRSRRTPRARAAYKFPRLAVAAAAGSEAKRGSASRSAPAKRPKLPFPSPHASSGLCCCCYTAPVRCSSRRRRRRSGVVAMAARKNAGVLALFDVDGTLTAPRKVSPFSSRAIVSSLQLHRRCWMNLVLLFFFFWGYRWWRRRCSSSWSSCARWEWRLCASPLHFSSSWFPWTIWDSCHVLVMYVLGAACHCGRGWGIWSGEDFRTTRQIRFWTCTL